MFDLRITLHAALAATLVMMGCGRDTGGPAPPSPAGPGTAGCGVLDGVCCPTGDPCRASTLICFPGNRCGECGVPDGPCCGPKHTNDGGFTDSKGTCQTGKTPVQAECIPIPPEALGKGWYCGEPASSPLP
jgi:hypothetical protein